MFDGERVMGFSESRKSSLKSGQRGVVVRSFKRLTRDGRNHGKRIFDAVLQFLVHKPQPVLTMHLLRNTAPFDENPCRFPRRAQNRSVDKIYPPLLWWFSSRGVHGQRHSAADVCFAGEIGLIQQLKKALTFYFGKNIANGSAKIVAVAGQALVRGVRKLKNMIRAPEDRHETRSVIEDAAKIFSLI